MGIHTECTHSTCNFPSGYTYLTLIPFRPSRPPTYTASHSSRSITSCIGD